MGLPDPFANRPLGKRCRKLQGAARRVLEAQKRPIPVHPYPTAFSSALRPSKRPSDRIARRDLSTSVRPPPQPRGSGLEVRFPLQRCGWCQNRASIEVTAFRCAVEIIAADPHIDATLNYDIPPVQRNNGTIA